MRHSLKILENAAAYYASGDMEKAEQEYLRVLDGDHDTSDILQVFARIAAKRGDREGANGYWDKILALDPRPGQGLGRGSMVEV